MTSPAGNTVELAVQVGSDCVNDNDDRYRNARGNKAVFNSRSRRIVFEERYESGHQRQPFALGGRQNSEQCLKKASQQSEAINGRATAPW